MLDVAPSKLNLSEATGRKRREYVSRELGIRNSAEMAAYVSPSQGSSGREVFK
jgi:hypothetical protein